MSFILQPWHLLLLVIAGRAQQDQQKTIDYLLAENQILRKKLGKKRSLLTDDERRLLAVKGKTLGRRLLEQLATIVTPDTILRWHRMYIAEKRNHTDRKTAGRRSATKCVSSCCGWRKKTPPGSTTGFKARWPTSAKSSPTPRWRTS